MVNLTDRSIVVCTPDGEPLLVLVPTGYVVRVRRLLRPVGTTLIDGVSVELYSERVSLEPELPAPRVAVRYVVEREVALARRQRRDLIFPNGGALDDGSGILRVASLASAADDVR